MRGEPDPAEPIPVIPESLLTPQVIEAAQALARGERTPAAAKPAATVVLLRDGTAGLEVYLLRRAETMRFAARMHVFPGGSVDERDAEQAVGWAGPPAAYWAQVFEADEPLARALVCAAVRETFEESGVLLAGADEHSVVVDTDTDGWETDRRRLLTRECSLAELLTRRGLVVRSDLLRPWAQWITPEVEPRRYDTRFFVAGLPAGQRTRDVGGEADRVRWLRVTDAIEAHESGALAMFPPTIETLREIAGHASVAEVLAASAGRRIVPLLPEIRLSAAGARLVLRGRPDG